MINCGLQDVRQIINVSGTMTGLGASSSPREVIRAVAEWLPRFVDMAELEGVASQAIQRVIGAESGCITACAASGISVAIAACMTGADPAKVERLPETSGMRSRVALQAGHSIWFGGRIRQLVELTGASAVEFGDATRASLYQMRHVLDEETAAALYVISHHTVQYGMVSLQQFCDVAHQEGIPVVVDAASESYMRSIVQADVDLAVFSGHKFLGGPTSGIIAGRRDLVEACLLNQTFGIGRPMKVGKEGIAGAIAALSLWQERSVEAEKQRCRSVLDQLRKGLSGLSGVSLSIRPDPTGNPIERLVVAISEEDCGLTAFQVSAALAEGDPSVRVRDHEVADHAMFELDPTGISLEEVDSVAEAICGIVGGSEPLKERIRNRYPRSSNLADWEISTTIATFRRFANGRSR